MTGEVLTKYQVMLLENPNVAIKTCNTLNPASFMPTSPMTHHSCEQVTAHKYASQPHLKDQPLRDSEDDWFTDGISFVSRWEH